MDLAHASDEELVEELSKIDAHIGQLQHYRFEILIQQHLRRGVSSKTLLFWSEAYGMREEVENAIAAVG